MSEKKHSPFDELSDDMKKITVDVGVFLTALSQRVPSGGEKLMELIPEHFVRSYNLPNSGKYALRHVLDLLFSSDWEVVITKRGVRMMTRFEPLQGENGQVTVIR